MDSETPRIPVWLDCDPGHDDAFAILLAAYHPAIELLGISTVHGNSSIEHTTINAGRILTAIGRPQVPVFRGASSGLARPAVHATAIHGISGLDGTVLLPQPSVPAITSTAAIDAIAVAILATPLHTSWLVATGALTNIAQLFDKYPNLVRHLKGLSIMGGAIGNSFTTAPLGKVGTIERFGNWTPYAEFNVVVDPEAAKLVLRNFELNAKTILIPLDVTHQVLATSQIQSLLLHGNLKGRDELDTAEKPSTLRTMLVELLNFFGHTYATVFGITEGPPLHDPLAVAAVLDGIPEYEIPFYDHVSGESGKKERYEVHITIEGTHEQALNGETETGRTAATLLQKGEGGIKIPRGLDVKRFWTVLEECLQRADEMNAKNGSEKNNASSNLKNS